MTTQEIINYYADLLIIQYVGKPKAYATIQALVKMVVMDQLPTQVQNAFNLVGTSLATGVQLDTLGKYAGVTRNGNTLKGAPVTLNDSDFISLIRLAIIKNNSGSSLSDIQNLLHTFFANEIFVFDGANMQMSYLIASSVGSQNLVNLFVTEDLLPRPMGVAIASITYLPTLDLFGFQSYSNIASAYSAITVYVVGARVQATTGIIYQSLMNGNVGNAVTNTTFWEPIIYPYNSYVTYPTFLTYHWLSYADGISI